LYDSQGGELFNLKRAYRVQPLDAEGHVRRNGLASHRRS
jgi:hypothetical protein